MADEQVKASSHVVPGSHEDRLVEVTNLRLKMEENFHLYEEIKALPQAEQDALFKLLYDAQMGDPSALEDIYRLVYDEVPVGLHQSGKN